MAAITIKNITKVYPGNTNAAVSDISLEIEDREFVVFVGPSGCGKSTTLRMIAGLEGITSGELYIGDKLMNHVAPKKRNIAMVFQSYALYPHMTVYKNMAFALKIRRLKKQFIDERVRETAEMLGITHLLARKPRALSGGESQRVALGRAMVRNPEVFLLDEPLSNLDAKLRADMRAELVKLHRKLQTTFVYVTHDQTEAMTMADRIVLMDKGNILQVDTPMNIYDYPANTFAAGFIGSPRMNFADCTIAERGGAFFADVGGEHTVPLDGVSASDNTLRGMVGRAAIIGIRPEHLDVIPDGMGAMFTGVADTVEATGAETNVYVDVDGGLRFIARDLGAATDIKPGARLSLAADAGRIHIFDAESGDAVTGRYA